MSSLQFAKLNLDMIALNIQSLNSASERNEALDLLAQLAQDLEKSNQAETVFENYKNQLLRTTVSVASSQELSTIAVSKKLRLSEKKALLEEKYKCQRCGKCFPSSSKLLRHSNSSRGCTLFASEESKAFQCPECDHRTNTRDGLTTHRVKHTDRYKCIECGRGFSCPRDQEKHQRNPKNCQKYMSLMEHSSSLL